jgi:hypothetical protein
MTERALPGRPRIAAIATMASRLQTFSQVLPVIHAQVDHVFVYLDGYGEPPAFLRDFERVTVRRAEDVGDLHASSRFLCLQDLTAPALVAVVDDDILYPPDYVEALAGALEALGGDAVVGVHGRIFIPPHRSYARDATSLHFAHALAENQPVDELGTGTCAFLSDRFRVDPRAWDRTDMDDLLIAMEAQRQGLPRIAIARPQKWLRALAKAQADSLWLRTQADDSVQTRRMRELMGQEG